MFERVLLLRRVGGGGGMSEECAKGGSVSISQRTSVSGIILREYHVGVPQVLIVRKRSSWILPGGKHDGGERDSDCLDRELGEELVFRCSRSNSMECLRV